MRTIARAPEWVLGRRTPIGGFMWVSVGASDLVPRINTTTGVIDITSVSVPNNPQALAWDGSTHMYVAETDSTLVAEVKLSSLAIDATIDVGSSPIDFAKDATYMYVTAAGGTITRIAIATGLVSGTPISVPGTNGVPNRAAKDSGNYLYVTSNNVDPGISKIIRASASSWGASSTFNLLQVYPGRLAWDGGDYLYIITANNTITKVSVATGLPVKVIQASSTLRYDILWDGATHIYVTAAYAILTLDLTTDTFDTTIAMSGYSVQGLARDGSGNIYSANYASSGDIVKISIATRAIVGTLVGFSYPQHVAWDGGSYIWVVNSTATAYVSLVSISSFTISTTVTLSPTAYSPNEIAWDGGSYMYICEPYHNKVFRIAIAGGHAQNVISGFNSNGYTLPLGWDGASHMFFSDSNTNTVSTVPVATGTAIDNTIVTGTSPYDFERDGSGNLHVPNQIACTLSRVVVSSQTVDRTTNLPNTWDGIAWDGGSHMYVCNSAMNQVSRVVSSSGSVNKVITVGTTPKKVAWDGALHMYVTNYGDGTVSRILISSGVVDATIAVGTEPDEVRWDGGSYMYVNNTGSNDVSRVPVAFATVDLTIPGFSDPEFSAWDGGTHLWVTSPTDNSVSRIDTITGDTDTTTVGTLPHGVAWDGGSYMYVCNQDGSVTRLSVATGAVVGSPLSIGGSAYVIAWDGGSYMYAFRNPSAIVRIDISTFTIHDTIPLADDVNYLVWDGGSYMWGVGFSYYSIRIDISTGVVTMLPSLGGNPKDAVPVGPYMYVTDASAGTVRRHLISTGDLDITTSVGASSYPTGITWDGQYLWVSLFSDNAVVRVKTEPFSVEGDPIPVGTSPLHITWDHLNHVYSSNINSGSLSRIISGAETPISLSGVPTGLAWDGPIR